MKVDPIIAVRDVRKTLAWYQSVFDCRSRHGGDEFNVLVDPQDKVFLCLHKWGEHDHPSMQSGNTDAGNGLILYFRTKSIRAIRQRLKDLDYPVDRELEMSPNSRREEFSFRDPDGYYITIAEFHDYEG